MGGGGAPFRTNAPPPPSKPPPPLPKIFDFIESLFADGSGMAER